METTNSPTQQTQPKGGTQANLPPGRSWLIFLLILALNYLVVRSFLPAPGEPITVPYTIFKEQAGKGNVASIYSRGTSVEGRFKSPVTWPPEDGAKAANVPGKAPPSPVLDGRRPARQRHRPGRLDAGRRVRPGDRLRGPHGPRPRPRRNLEPHAPGSRGRSSRRPRSRCTSASQSVWASTPRSCTCSILPAGSGWHE